MKTLPVACLMLLSTVLWARNVESEDGSPGSTPDLGGHAARIVTVILSKR
jgi:hypothetical protein